MTQELHEQALEYAKAMYSAEELHEDLLPYVEQGEWGEMLRHPLVYDVPWIFSKSMANARYKQKKKAVEQALVDRNYSRYVFLHERPYRLEAFMSIQYLLSNQKYSELLAEIWIDTENQHAYLEEWKTLLSAPKLRREHFMTAEDREALAALPDFVTVYRGCQRGLNENGLSWTLDSVKAKFFAYRFSKQGMVLQRQISKTEIVALLLGRGESEVILL